MVKRFSWNTFLYMAFALIILLVSWENNRSHAAVVEGDIPEQSIRLRILANSDSVADQALKRHIRDAVVEEMNGWVAGPTGIEEARAIVRGRLPELQALVDREIAALGYTYPSKVELGLVPFPAKMYGTKVYPAGDYEALRITIGEGNGQNWWCVLFPPLCFVDAASGEAVEKDKAGTEAKKKEAEKREVKIEKKEKKRPAVKILSAGSDDEKKDVPQDDQAQDQDEEKPEKKKKFKFFIWEKIKSWFS